MVKRTDDVNRAGEPRGSAASGAFGDTAVSGRFTDRDHDNDYSQDNESSERIRARIGHTRAQMDETVDEIQNRMSLDYITHSAMDMVRDGARNAACSVGRVVREHPLPTIVVGAGILWMLMRERNKRSESYSYAADWDEYDSADDDYATDYAAATGGSRSGVGRAMSGVRDSASRFTRSAKDNLSQAGSKVKDAASHLGEHVKDTVQNVGGQIKDRVQNVTGKLADSAQDIGSRAMHKVTDLGSQVGQQVQYGARQARTWFDETYDEYPVAVGAAFFTLGLATGAAIPSTTPEDRLMGPVRDRLMDEAEDLGADLLHRGEDVAERAVSAVKDAVSEGAERVEQKVQGQGAHGQSQSPVRSQSQGFTSGQGSDRGQRQNQSQGTSAGGTADVNRGRQDQQRSASDSSGNQNTAGGVNTPSHNKPNPSGGPQTGSGSGPACPT